MAGYLVPSSGSAHHIGAPRPNVIALMALAVPTAAGIAVAAALSAPLAVVAGAGLGVLAMFSDSTNADRPGVTGSEREVIDGFEEVFSSAPGKIVVTAFASSV